MSARSSASRHPGHQAVGASTRPGLFTAKPPPSAPSAPPAAAGDSPLSTPLSSSRSRLPSTRASSAAGSAPATPHVPSTPLGLSTACSTPASHAPPRTHIEGEGCLELEHVVGFSANFKQTFHAHPTLHNKTVACVSAMVVLGDVTEPHQQTLLRAHDMEVSALALSNSGELIASGQVGTVHRKGFGAPVVVWSYATKAEMYVLHGITQRVNRLTFSPDDRLLLGTGEDGHLFIWDMQTGEVVYSRRGGSPISLAQWAHVFLKGRRPAYELATATQNNKEVSICEFSFDATRVQWTLVPSPVTMPCTGLVRRFLCSGVSGDGDSLLVGTEAGEMVVIRIPARVYRASIPVGSGGIWSMLVLPPSVAQSNGRGVLGGDVVACGCGDGTIKLITGVDMRWELVRQVRLPCVSRVMALSLTADHSEILTAASSGESYRLLAEDLSVQLLSSSHTGPIAALAFPPTRADVFATGGADGVLKVWDLGSYAVVASAKEDHSAGGITAMVWLDEGHVVTGWGDGFLRTYSAAGGGAKVWMIPNAHRRKVTALASHRDASSGWNYLVSGGGDGSVRVWHGKTRELLMQFTEHTKAVTAVVVDVGASHLVHSASEDCMLLSYNVKTGRRYNIHTVRDGAFLCLSQRLDGEKELVTSDSHARLLFWDCDYAEATLAVYDDTHTRLTCVKVSPSTGRYILTAGADAGVKALELQTLGNGYPRPIGLGHAHTATVTALAWSPDEKQVVSIGEDASICVWNFYGTD